MIFWLPCLSKRLRQLSKLKKMYKYSSGLICDASPLRVRLYELLVPPLCGGALLVGVFYALWALFDPSAPLLSLIKGVVVGTVWAVLCGLVGYLVFQVWCRPRDESASRTMETNNEH